MTKLRLYKGLSIFLAFLVYACTSPKPRPTPTFTPTASIAVVTQTAEATQDTQSRLVPCANVENPSSLYSKFPGTLIFEDAIKVTALDGTSLKEREIKNFSVLDNWYFVGLSPNGKWIGYTTYKPPDNWRNTTLHLLSATQDISTTLTANPGLPDLATESPLFPIIWVNDEYWLIAGKEYLGLANPFNGTWDRSLLSKLPNRYDQSGVAFSPDLGMALFVQGTNENKRLVLINLQSGEQPWVDPVYLGDVPYSRTPYLVGAVWSKDSSTIAFPIDVLAERSVHLLMVDREGRITVIRPTAQTNGGYGHSWSPDGRYMAFVGLLEKDPTRTGIILYDRITNSTLDMCPIQDNATGSLETNSLVWSPDSQYLVFTTGTDTLDESNRLVMLNIYTGEVTLLKHGPRMRLIGWSVDNEWVTP